MNPLSYPYRFYRYVYYRLYSWNLITWGESDLPHVNALLGMAFLLFLHFFSIAVILEMIGFIILQEDGVSYVLIMGAISLVINYMAFIPSQKYRTLLNEFERESAEDRRRNLWWAWLYVLGSFGLVIIPAVIKKEFLQ